MILAISKLNRHGLSNTSHCEHLSKKTNNVFTPISSTRYFMAWHGTAQNNTAFTLRAFIYMCYITRRHTTSRELCLFTWTMMEKRLYFVWQGSSQFDGHPSAHESQQSPWHNRWVKSMRRLRHYKRKALRRKSLLLLSIAMRLLATTVPRPRVRWRFER